MIAAFDIGTTAVKAVVTAENGREICFCDSVQIHTRIADGYIEQSPDQWYEAFLAVSKKILGRFGRKGITALVFSGQMQDVIPVSEEGAALSNGILYSDGRAFLEAEKIKNAVDEKRIFQITGNHMDGSIPLAKILWLKEQRPEIYEKAAAFLISSKDYVIGKLTGNLIGDMTACATAGAMDLKKKTWSRELIRACGLDEKKFPRLLYAHEIAGVIGEKAARESGYLPGTTVYAGTGDAGATTLASGILNPGEYNINLGTSGWVAAVSEQFMDCEGGGFNLAAMQPGKYINVVPFLNGGNVHRFIASLLTPKDDGGEFQEEKSGENAKKGGGEFPEENRDESPGNAVGAQAGSQEPDYGRMSKLLRRSVPGSHGVLCLPYLTGERFPVMDSEIRGAFFGIGLDTRPEDMAGSALEGVAFSIRQGMELMGEQPKTISVIGGGAREAVWCQILSNVTGKPVYVYEKPDLLPALAIISSVLLSRGEIGGYEDFIKGLQGGENCRIFRPDQKAAALYEELFEKYKRLYPAVKGLQ